MRLLDVNGDPVRGSAIGRASTSTDAARNQGPNLPEIGPAGRVWFKALETMTLAMTSEPTPRLAAGEARVVSDAERESLLEQSRQDGYLVARLPAPGPGSRGRLALLLEDAVESTLDARGACPPGISASSNLDTSLSDQLYRARLLGSRGIVLVLSTLEGITNRAGALDADDSSALRWWIRVTHERPVRLYVDVRDRDLGVYESPRPLFSVLRAPDSDQSSQASIPSVSDSMVESGWAMRACAAESTVELEQAVSQGAIADEASSEIAEHESAPANSIDAGPPASEDSGVEILSTIDLDAETPDISLTSRSHFSAEPTVAVEESELPEQAETLATTPAARPETPESASSLTVPDFLCSDAADRWPEWIQQLEAARGPKPLAVVEQLFVSAYVPLSEAVARGIAGPPALEALQTWSSSFSHSYSEAFEALRVRGRRPLMVLDVPDAAMRIARLHGARSVQLILVDGMRFDLGLRVEARLGALLGQHAALTERLLLWSALPTTTATQLELIGRGPEGLREMVGNSDNPVLLARGRGASTLRRVRTGPRDVLKLDLVEAGLGEYGPSSSQRLDDLAISVADVLAGALLKLPPRTLAVVFGDHGFVLEPQQAGTRPARHGGASPEEVLVPAYAWLCGSMH